MNPFKNKNYGKCKKYGAISATRKSVTRIRRCITTSVRRRTPRRFFDINRIAGEIEGIGSLSVEDVEHVIKSLVRSMKLVLRDGNRVKLDGFGTFYITFRCPGVPSADKCSIKNISRVNIRFLGGQNPAPGKRVDRHHPKRPEQRGV